MEASPIVEELGKYDAIRQQYNQQRRQDMKNFLAQVWSTTEVMILCFKFVHLLSFVYQIASSHKFHLQVLRYTETCQRVEFDQGNSISGYCVICL